MIPIPETLDDALTPAWLTAALGVRFPGIEVTNVVPGPVVSRLSTNARFRIECAGGLPEGLSPNLCIKGYFTEIGRPYAADAGEPETRFYRDLTSLIEMRTLRCVFADLDPATRIGVVVTEDVVEQGGVFLDALSDYSPDQAAQSLEQLALLHAGTWMRADVADVPALAPRFHGYLARRGRPEIAGNFDGPIGVGVPVEVRDADRLVRAYTELAALASAADPWCVIHGDAHVGNVYLDGTGRPSFVDWQLVQRGPWYLDVGYHLCSALSVDDRRANERDLVGHYLARLTSAGVPAPSEAEVGEGIRRGILHGFYLWGITQQVAPPITTMLLTRLGTAAADHDAYGSVGA